eukprot:3557999-Rhodomonas_salina.2
MALSLVRARLVAALRYDSSLRAHAPAKRSLAPAGGPTFRAQTAPATGTQRAHLPGSDTAHVELQRPGSELGCSKAVGLNLHL